MTVRVMQFGTTGQLGRELLLNAADFPVEIQALSRADCDFEDPEKAARLVWEWKPDLVVIAAAYTAVDLAETEAERAWEINAETPIALAGICGKAGPALVNLSTDYVFDGEKGAPYTEDDPVSPLNTYGRYKAHTEKMVLACCPRAMVLRTSWVVSAHGKNFIKTMLRLAAEGQPIRVVDDQFGRPTAARDLARFILSQAERLAAAPAGDPAFGLFNFANAGETSWKAFAETIFELAFGAGAPKVEAIKTADRPSPAQRPLRGTLDTGKLERTFGYHPRPWRDAVAEIVAELKAETQAA